jgi:hypothetical protein
MHALRVRDAVSDLYYRLINRGAAGINSRQPGPE